MSKNKSTSLSWLFKPLILVFVILFGVGLFKTGESFLKKSLTAFQNISQSNLIELEPVTLKRVVDGDTIIVLDSNQNEMRVRMIGIDTPESVHPEENKNTTDGDIASAYTKSQLEKGQILYLEYDKERLDQYGRTLAYVWLEDNVDPTDSNDVQDKMYNAKLIVNGYAIAKRFPPNTKYATIFESLERK